MTVPAVLESRLQTAIAAVNASTDLDLLISLVDAGHRAGVDVAVAATELSRRANLVDSNTPTIEAAKLAAGLFKVSNPTPDLWNASGGSGGGTEVGQLVSGFFAGNPKYVPANGSRYLLSAYPDMAALLTAGALPSFYEPIKTVPVLAVGRNNASAGWRESSPFTDGNVIWLIQQPTSTQTEFLLNVSTDAGVTWKGVFPKNILNSSTMPEFTGGATLYNAHVLTVCKLDTPGAYGIILATQTYASESWYAYTEDYGMTWKGFSRLPINTDPAQPTRHRLYRRNGVLLYVSPGMAAYSTTNGATWTQLTDSLWSQGNTAVYHTLSDDGYILLTNQTTSVIYLQWPATPAEWSAAIPFTTVASKLPAARQTLKKCGEYWVAFSSTTRAVYIATSLLGTYTAASFSTAINGPLDIIKVGIHFWVLATTPTGNGLFYSVAETSLGGPIEMDNSLTPAFRNASASFRWPLLSTKFSIALDFVETALIRHGREDLLKILTPQGAGNFQKLRCSIPTNVNPNFCRKYGMWFCSIPQIDVIPSSPQVTGVDWSMTLLHYRSVDGENWIPIGTGRGGIVDAGGRLLRLNASSQLEQSTDGVVWDTTGITRPTVTSSVSRLWRVKDVIFYCTSNSTSSYSTGYFYASTNQGATWTAVTGVTAPGMLAIAKGSMTYYGGKYYALNCYAGGSPGSFDRTLVDTVNLYESSDGISWSSVYSSTFTASTWIPGRCMLLPLGSAMFLFVGSLNGSNQNLIMVTSNGRYFTNGSVGSLVYKINAASTIDFDTSNGDLRWSYDADYSLLSSALKTTFIFKGNVQETILAYSNGNSLLYPSNVTGAEGHLIAAAQALTFVYSPESTSFAVPIPNSGASPMPSPFMRVAA